MAAQSQHTCYALQRLPSFASLSIPHHRHSSTSLFSVDALLTSTGSQVKGVNAVTSCRVQAFFNPRLPEFALSRELSLPSRGVGDKRQNCAESKSCFTAGGRRRAFEVRGLVSMVQPDINAGGEKENEGSLSRPDMFSTSPYVPPPWAAHLHPIPASYTSLGIFPTPIHRWDLPGLPAGTEIWIKRDDLTGMQLSGNKVRKLEFLIADAKAQGADCVITIGGIQSNHCRATAVAARYAGLDSYLILRTSQALVEKDPGLTGNLLIERLVGAHIELVSKEEYIKLGSLTLGNILLERLKAEGRKPYLIPVGGSNSLGSWGYIEGVRELENQLQHGKVKGVSHFDDIVMACGSGGTTAGLSLGSHLSSLKSKVHAYAVCDDEEYFYNFAQELLEGLGANVSSRDIVEVKLAKGQGYAISTAEELELVKTIAEATGVVLDPVYSGKALNGLMKDFLKNPGYWEGKKVLFLHTGGLLGMYDKVNQLGPLVGKQQRLAIPDSILQAGSGGGKMF